MKTRKRQQVKFKYGKEIFKTPCWALDRNPGSYYNKGFPLFNGKINIFEKEQIQMYLYLHIIELEIHNLSLQKGNLIYYGKCWKDGIGLSKVELWYLQQFNLGLLKFN